MTSIAENSPTPAGSDSPHPAQQTLMASGSGGGSASLASGSQNPRPSIILDGPGSDTNSILSPSDTSPGTVALAPVTAPPHPSAPHPAPILDSSPTPTLFPPSGTTPTPTVTTSQLLLAPHTSISTSNLTASSASLTLNPTSSTLLSSASTTSHRDHHRPPTTASTRNQEVTRLHNKVDELQQQLHLSHHEIRKLREENHVLKDRVVKLEDRMGKLEEHVVWVAAATGAGASPDFTGGYVQVVERNEHEGMMGRLPKVADANVGSSRYSLQQINAGSVTLKVPPTASGMKMGPGSTGILGGMAASRDQKLQFHVTGKKLRDIKPMNVAVSCDVYPGQHDRVMTARRTMNGLQAQNSPGQAHPQSAHPKMLSPGMVPGPQGRQEVGHGLSMPALNGGSHIIH
ncbi:hypothetical protein HK102_000474 [Quaeritorhiza haematococci]|nr:hypothetical protein HK102_000474 [Quaeritorhiza haematococci]